MVLKYCVCVRVCFSCFSDHTVISVLQMAKVADDGLSSMILGGQEGIVSGGGYHGALWVDAVGVARCSSVLLLGVWAMEIALRPLTEVNDSVWTPGSSRNRGFVMESLATARGC